MHIHQYQATVTWRGSTSDGYEGYDRSHVARAGDASLELRLSSDPAFRGDPGLLNPEQLVVLAVASCQLLSFLAVAARAHIDVLEYEDTAVGEMPERPRPMSVERIVLRPRIIVRGPATAQKVLRLVDLAHAECYIANSLRTEIQIYPQVMVREG